MRFYSVIVIFMMCLVLFAQKENAYLEGTIYGRDKNGAKEVLFGANAYWLGTNSGAVTNENGEFRVPREEGNHMLVISYVGYKTDTLHVHSSGPLDITLNSSLVLGEVMVEQRSNSTVLKTLTPIKYEVMGEKELLKAACCNLSESFETNPSVDVSFTDAVTGTRQILMLGLAGPYSQITRENMPDVRGLSSIYGLTFVPGTWVESIQLNKGAGSVVNGFESIAGQINIELRKPESADQLYFNAYGNESGRLELNLNLAHQLNSHWSTALLLHSKNNSFRLDRNEDGFMDHPLSEHYIGMNRWKYAGDNGLRFQVGVKGTYIDNIGGQIDFDPDQELELNNLEDTDWGMTMNLQRYEVWAKLGKVYEETPWRSMALQLSGSTHQQNSDFGLNSYDADQQSFYANYLYQSIIGNTNHNFKTGASFQMDSYEEVLNGEVFDHKELVPGVFFEYSYSFLETFDLVGGLRVDYHNLFGVFATPRMHLRYAPRESTILRASFGRGLRSASILSENSGILASARTIEIMGTDSDKPFGLDQEIAWNYGLNFTQKFQLDYREGSFTLDLYRTDFKNQIVLDLEDPRKARFYNLDGESYSNSIQAQFDYELIKRLGMRVAYRWYDVKTKYISGLLSKPLLASHLAFVNLAYESRKHWKFDYTINWQGAKRIPSTISNPEQYQLSSESPGFVMMNVQLSKEWSEKFEIYVGMENLTNFKQDNPIIAANEPFSEYFDSSLIWGPIFGRNTYVGIRYKLK